MDLEFILQKNLKGIIKKYASYVDTLRSIVNEKGVTPEDLRSYLMSLPAFSASYKGQKLSLLADKEAELEKCNTVTSIFTFLTTKCASFLNYEIFQSILEHYNVKVDQERLKYQDHLDAYIKKHKIAEFIKINPLLKTIKWSKELTLKFDIESTCRLAKVDELKQFLAEILDLNPSSLQIVDIQEGCITVTFMIPTSVADALFTPDTKLTSQQEEKFRAALVLWLKCNSCTFHFKESEESITSSTNPG